MLVVGGAAGADFAVVGDFFFFFPITCAQVPWGAVGVGVGAAGGGGGGGGGVGVGAGSGGVAEDARGSGPRGPVRMIDSKPFLCLLVRRGRGQSSGSI